MKEAIATLVLFLTIMYIFWKLPLHCPNCGLYHENSFSNYCKHCREKGYGPL